MSLANAVSAESPSEGTTKFVRDVFFANLPLPFQKLRTYLWLVCFSRALGPSGYGEWALFQSTLGIGLILASMTQGNAMMRFITVGRTREDVNRAFSSVLVAVSAVSLLVAMTLAACSNVLSELLFRDGRGRSVFLLTAMIIPAEICFEMMRGLLRARRQNRQWAFFTLIRQMPETLLLILIVWYWIKSPATLIAGYLVMAILSAVLGLVYLICVYGIRPRRPSAEILSKYLPYGLALIPGGLISLLSFSADRFLVAHYLNLQQVGIYTVCFTVSSLGFFFVGPLNDVLLPEMSALHDAQNWNEFDKRFSTIQRAVMGISIAGSAILIAFPTSILQLFTTRDFVSGAPALAILGLQGAFMSLVMLYVVIMYVRFRVWWTTVTWAVMGALVLSVDVLLLPSAGIRGASWSQLISSVAGAALVIGLNWDVFKRTFHAVWILQTGLGLLAVQLVASFWHVHAYSPGQSVLRIATGAAVYVAALFATGFWRMSDLAVIRASFSRH
jgi:O-antigen/teichoic acid export membrane protein